MITRKKILALLFTAISLLGLLPLSVSAYTPTMEDVIYTYVDANVIPTDEYQTDPYLTPILGELKYFSCEGSPDIEGTVSIDVYTSEISEIGYISNLDFSAVVMNVYLTSTIYIPALSPYPISTDKYPTQLSFLKLASDPRIIVIAVSEQMTLTTFVSTNSNVDIVLRDIFSYTDRDILATTLQAFTTDLSNLNTQNYVDWIIDGYDRIINVFVNNAKIQYVLDNPIFIIALVVFAMAIAFAIATFIFKLFRR